MENTSKLNLVAALMKLNLVANELNTKAIELMSTNLDISEFLAKESGKIISEVAICIAELKASLPAINLTPNTTTP